MSPSTSEQWLGCDGWLAVTSDLPGTPSGPAAREGTLAHEWGEMALRDGRTDLQDCVGLGLDGQPGGRGALTKEMADYLQIYLDTIWSLYSSASGVELYVEKRVSPAAWFGGTSDGDGTADAILYAPAVGALHVIDLKYGAGKMVSALGNSQAQQYAQGAIEAFASRGVSSLTVWIVQPRGYDNPVKDWQFSLFELFAHGERVKSAVARNRGLVGAAPDAIAAACTTGEHCRWCKGNYWGKCAKLKGQASAAAREGFAEIKVATPDDVAKRYAELPALDAYKAALEERAFNEAMKSNLRGWKVVETDGRRAWKDKDAAARVAGAMIDGAFSEPELLTVTQLEKKAGKKRFAELFGDLVTAPKLLKIVAEDDPRPPAAASDPSAGF